MITAIELCQCIISKFCRDEKIDISELKETDAMKSSKLGIAMDNLGMISDPEIKEYLQDRGGVVATFYNDFTNTAQVLSLRSLLKILPQISDTDSHLKKFNIEMTEEDIHNLKDCISRTLQYCEPCVDLFPFTIKNIIEQCEGEGTFDMSNPFKNK